MYKRVCNKCGKEFDMWDIQENFSLHTYVGYGSRFDGCSLDLDLCCNCMDELLEQVIIPNCKHSPIIDRSAPNHQESGDGDGMATR